MSEAARLLPPEPSAPRVLAYRPHIRWAYYLCLVKTVLFAGSAIYSNFDALGLSFAFSFFALGFFFFRPMAATTVQAYDDRLVMQRFGQSIEIPYAHIERMNTRHLPMLFGWFTIMTSAGKRYRFFPVLERNNYLLDAISTSQPALVPPKKMDNFRRTLVALDHSWARVYASLYNFKRIGLVYLAFPFALTVVGALTQEFLRNAHYSLAGVIVQYGIIALVNVVAGVFVWFFSDLYLQFSTLRALEQNPLVLVRDRVQETRVFGVALWAHFFVTAIVTPFLMI
jgi:hypothetical protein